MGLYEFDDGVAILTWDLGEGFGKLDTLWEYVQTFSHKNEQNTSENLIEIIMGNFLRRGGLFILPIGATILTLYIP